MPQAPRKRTPLPGRGRNAGGDRFGSEPEKHQLLEDGLRRAERRQSRRPVQRGRTPPATSTDEEVAARPPLAAHPPEVRVGERPARSACPLHSRRIIPAFEVSGRNPTGFCHDGKIRKGTNPEEVHKEIYRVLGIPREVMKPV